MNTRTALALPLLLAPLAASADLLGVRIGVDAWSYDISGTARYQTRDSDNDIDVNRDLGYDDDDLVHVYAVIEHPIPVLPNLRVAYSNIDSEADGTLSKSFVYGGIVFDANEDVQSSVELKQTDVTLYYEILNNVLSLDLGVNAKYIDSEARITGEISGSESADISGLVPMLYAAVGADLPFTGLSIGGDGSAIQYQDSTFYDYSLRIRYTSPLHIGLEGGWRAVKLDLDDFDDSFADLEFDGPYAGLYLSF